MQNLEAINRAIEFIENNLYESITVLDVAKSASYSYYHFHRFFYLTMNETIVNYIRSRRLTQAAFDLNHSKKSIINISLSLGFETPESFTRAFKKRYSITPSAYRKQGLDILIGNRPSMLALRATTGYSFKLEIINLSPSVLVGVRFPSIQIKDGYTEAWRIFKKELQQDFVQSNFYGVFESNEIYNSNTFSLESEASIFIGTAVSNDSILKKYKTKTLKGGKYAKFTYIGTINNLLQFYKYIWGEWSVNSEYELDNREDFEIYTERFTGENDSQSEIDIYIPIKQLENA